MESRTQPAPARRPAEPDAARREDEGRAREAAHQQSVEALSAPEQPTPTQAEADAMKEHAIEGEAPAAPETEAQRKEREQRERDRKPDERRDVKPDASRTGYQTR